MHQTYPFCDNHILVAEKPAGLTTQEGFDLEIKYWLKKKFQKPGNVFLEPIHRLDKPVSGLVLFARTSKALSRLQEEMRKKAIKKTYFALVEGNVPESEGSLEHFLLHDDFKARVVSVNDKNGKQARLHYKVLEKRKETTLIEIELETGRYHQIRAQFSFIGCPIVGDIKYGSLIPFKEFAIALHHGKLSFKHPVSSEFLTFTSKPLFL